MAIKRACSWQATIKTPEAPENYSVMLLTFQQRQRNIISKNKSDFTVNSDSVTVYLTQEETAQLTDKAPCLMQLRCFSSVRNAPGSAIWRIDVQAALDDIILGGA